MLLIQRNAVRPYWPPPGMLLTQRIVAHIGRCPDGQLSSELLPCYCTLQVSIHHLLRLPSPLLFFFLKHPVPISKKKRNETPRDPKNLAPPPPNALIVLGCQLAPSHPQLGRKDNFFNLFIYFKFFFVFAPTLSYLGGVPPLMNCHCPQAQLQ